MDIIDNICDKLNVEKIRSKISPIDNIKLVHDIISDKSIIKQTIKSNYFNEKYNSDEYKFIFDTLLNPDYEKVIYLLNNHYINMFLDIYFVIGNVYLFNEEMFEIIYKNRKFINLIPDIIKKCWANIFKYKLDKFYNNELIHKWIKTSEFKLITLDKFLAVHTNQDLYSKYLEIYNIFDKNVCELKRFIIQLENKIKTTHNPGCINLLPNMYFYFIRLHTGLNITTHKQIQILLRWASKELNQLEKTQYDLIVKVRPDLSGKTLKEMIKILHDDPQYKYKTKEEFVNNHKRIINEAHEYFIDFNNIKEYVKPKLTTIEDANLAGAYWAFDTFYLNTINWNSINKYEALALTLHEAVPGHHTQINYSVYSKSTEINIIYHLFGMTNGFSEGWALFTEKIGPKYTDYERIGQLQYEILRTLRVIVDIAIHVGGYGPREIINYMKDHLAMPLASIESEVYRYITIPGQALCYKIGCEIFRYIYKRFGGANYGDEKSFDLYKKIIYGKEKALTFLLKEYNIIFEEVFTKV
jgi:hypothetical protein